MSLTLCHLPGIAFAPFPFLVAFLPGTDEASAA